MKFRVIVKTNSKRSEISDIAQPQASTQSERSKGETIPVYKISLKAKPIEGEANKELIKFLRKEFKQQARIVSGFKSKEKLIELFEF